MSKEAVLIVDHGSRKKAANDMIFSVVNACQKKLDTHIVVGAHMELSDPSILDGFKSCVEQGATYITVIPFMLSPGRHSTEDIPNLCQEASIECNNIPYCVTTHFGEHELVSEILAQKALACPKKENTACPKCNERSK